VLYWIVYEVRAFSSLEGSFGDVCFALFWWLPAFSILLLMIGQEKGEQQTVSWKIVKIFFVITFLVVLSIPVIDYIRYVWPPSDEEFARSVHLDFAASDRYDKVKTMFYIRISSSGRTIWPPSDSTFHMWIDGKRKPMPTEWPPEVYYGHILPSHPRGAAWWMTLDELKDWIGEGEHILQFQFRNVKSNELKIIVPSSGRVKCDPEADMGDWEKVR